MVDEWDGHSRRQDPDWRHARGDQFASAYSWLSDFMQPTLLDRCVHGVKPRLRWLSNRHNRPFRNADSVSSVQTALLLYGWRPLHQGPQSNSQSRSVRHPSSRQFCPLFWLLTWQRRPYYTILRRPNRSRACPLVCLRACTRQHWRCQAYKRRDVLTRGAAEGGSQRCTFTVQLRNERVLTR